MIPIKMVFVKIFFFWGGGGLARDCHGNRVMIITIPMIMTLSALYRGLVLLPEFTLFF